MNKKDFRVIKDFPKEGINFIDIMPILNDKDLFAECIKKLENKLVSQFAYDDIDVIVGGEARGFIFGAALAAQMGVRFVPIRKAGKLPGRVIKGAYSLEYGTDSLEIQSDSIKLGDKVVIVDDILATGGTVECMINLVDTLGGEVKDCLFVADLSDLPGVKRLNDWNVKFDSLFSFSDKYLTEVAK